MQSLHIGVEKRRQPNLGQEIVEKAMTQENHLIPLLFQKITVQAVELG